MFLRTAQRVSPAPRLLAAPLLTGLLIASAASAAGVAYRVKDLEPTAGPPEIYELQPLASNGALALAWGEVRHESAPEAWVTDGTAAGSRRLRDLAPSGSQSEPSGAAAIGGGILFPADSPGTGVELWWTDGTIAGTRLVRDIRPGRAGSNPTPIGVLSGLYLFAADDGVHGRELWKSDGSAAGTVLVADIRAGAEGSLSDATGGVLNARLYFAADDGVRGAELWRTDGHPAGTYLLKSLVGGAAGGDPGSFRLAGARLLFAGTDGSHGRELWATDGSAAGTALVADLRPGAAGSAPEPFESLPGRALLAADDGGTHGRSLWASDGTASGTRLLAHVLPGSGAGETEPPVWSGRLGSRAVFAASDGIQTVAWTSDGTVAGTTRLCGAVPPGDCARPQGFAAVADALVFTAYHTDGSYWIWRTDGTSAGTSMLAEAAGGEYVEVAPAVPAGGAWVLSIYRIFFPGPSYDEDRTLWRTDGTPGGTTRVDVLSAPQSPSYPHQLNASEAGIIFTAYEPEPDLVLRSDGTEAGTTLLDCPETGTLSNLGGAALLPDGDLVFSATAGGFGGLYRTDGEVASVVLLDFSSGGFERSGEFVFLRHGPEDELWRTDGTAGGTVLVREVGAAPSDLADVFGKLWFRVRRSQIEWSLWESLGTAATTIEHLLPGIDFGYVIPAIRALDPETGSFTFQATDGLYRFDPATNEANRFWALPRLSNGDDQAVLGATLYFRDEEPDGSCTLWASDGTGAGTARVKTWAAGGCFESRMVVMGGRLFFAACNLTAGCELWRSDGTAAGTVLVKDIDPGLFSATPGWMTVAGNRLYFVACDGPTGCEPWVSDGTGAGTHRVDDIAPGPASGLSAAYGSQEDSRTPNLTHWDRLVFFAADDGTGSELWAMPVEIFYDGFESGSTARW